MPMEILHNGGGNPIGADEVMSIVHTFGKRGTIFSLTVAIMGQGHPWPIEPIMLQHHHLLCNAGFLIPCQIMNEIHMP